MPPSVNVSETRIFVPLVLPVPWSGILAIEQGQFFTTEQEEQEERHEGTTGYPRSDGGKIRSVEPTVRKHKQLQARRFPSILPF